jgi:predicted O-linked N-acetylglucosamine transferase (SPINDLY family)
MRLANRWPGCFAEGDVQFTDPQAALNHAMDLHRQGRLAEAENLYRQLQQRFPQATDILHLIGLVEVDTGRVEQGMANLRRVVELQPNVPHYHANLGARLIDQRRATEAEACLRAAIRLQPDLSTHHYNLGNALLQLRRATEAADSYREALRLQPDNADCDLQLGIALHTAERREEALAWYRSVLARRPGHLAVATNLGAMLQEDCDLDGAAECFRLALRTDPNNPVPLNNLAVIHKDLGEAAEAVRLLRRCAELTPDNASMRSNLILIMHYDPATTDAEIRAEHETWNRLHVRAKTSPSHRPEPARRLRIGFVSPDFRDHVVGRALLPSFAQHDRKQFEIFAYANCPGDAFTANFQRHADGWRDIGGMPDEEVVALIKADAIDILVDLSLHTSDNRLTVFAQKPAPLQVSWLGYPESSGLATTDYRLTDAHLEPPGGNRIAHPAEQAWLLPDCWTCYEPPAGYPEVNALPSEQGRPFTFGSLNNSCKINGEVLSAWAKLLLATPGSRLRLLAKQGSHRRRIVAELGRLGIDAERVQFAEYLPATPGLEQGALLSRYHDIDLALDTFPYGGMTTTLDALWMGVPVVSLVGGRNLGRAGLSLLSNVGLAELAVSGVDAYVAMAVGLAQDRPRLAKLRATLRQRMQGSPLLDAEGFTRKVETGFREMWVDWCRRQAAAG